SDNFAGSDSSRWSYLSRFCSSDISTWSRKVLWNGSRIAGSRAGASQRWHAGNPLEQAPGLGAKSLALADGIRTRLLRDRNDGDRRVAVRSLAIWRRAFSGVASPERPDDRLRPGVAQD